MFISSKNGLARLVGPDAAATVAGLAAVAVLGGLVTTAPAAASQLRHATNVSANWAGYAVTGRRASQRFTQVAASWTQPAATCRAGQSSYSAFWIGLGGFRRSARRLEQVGTEIDCTPRGATVNYAWLEMVPAAPVNLRLAVRAGDTISARVSAVGSRVTVLIADLSNGRVVNRTLRLAPDADTSSAEWIAEAPSACGGDGGCRVLPLADFGAVSFSQATVSSAGQSGPISQVGWSLTRVELRDDLLSVSPGQFGVRALLAQALPSALAGSGRSFSVSWQAVSSSGPPQVPGSAGPPA